MRMRGNSLIRRMLSMLASTLISTRDHLGSGVGFMNVVVRYDKIPVEVSGAGAAEISPLEQFNDGGEVAAAIVENIKR